MAKKQQDTPTPQNNGWTRYSEPLDYDTMLAHYDQDPGAPTEKSAKSKEKKSFINSLLEDVSAQGKFAKKHGSKASREEPLPQPAPTPTPASTPTPAPTPTPTPAPTPPKRKKPAPPAATAAPDQPLPPCPPAAPDQEVPSPPPPPAAPVEEAPAPPPEQKPKGPTLAEKMAGLRGRFAKSPGGTPENPKKPEKAPAPPAKVPPPAKTPPPVETPPPAAAPPPPKAPSHAKKRVKAPKKPSPKPRLPLWVNGQQKPDASLSLLEWAYVEVYYIGILLLRDIHVAHRQLSQVFRWAAREIPAWLEARARTFGRICDSISENSLFPYREIAKRTGYLYHCLRGVGHKKGSLTIKLRFWGEYFHTLVRPLNHIANFLAPIIGITILAATVNYFTGLTYGLAVDYAGQPMGYIAEESVFYDAQQAMLGRMINEEYQAPENDKPTFRLTMVSPTQLTDQETLANRLISISKNEVEEADGVYIEEAFLGAVQDGDEFLLYIDSILDGYRTGTEHELVQFVKSISVRKGIYPTSSVVPLYRITDDLESAQTRTVDHLVKAGDTLESVAQEYHTTVEQLKLLNPILDQRVENSDTGLEVIPLVEGENLVAAKVNLSLGVQVTRRETYVEDIDFGTTTVEDSRYYKTYEVTISGGVKGKQEVEADVTYIDGEKVGENRIKTPVVLQEPVNRKVLVGTMPLLQYLPSGSNSNAAFMWPVKGGYMSAGLYGYYGHTGMDIAAPGGTIIRAAKSGQVTYASNYSVWPYGKRVDLSHGDGVMSRYAHCSAVYVVPGQYVNQGDIIAAIGRTGNASGNHCHFEIRINGQVMDPAKFVGNYYPGY